MAVRSPTLPVAVPGRSPSGGVAMWWPVIAAALLPLAAPASWPAWAVMWASAFAIYVACKWLTWSRAGMVGVPRWRSAAWPGLDAPAFLAGREVDRPTGKESGFATAKFVVGVALAASAVRLEEVDELVRGWVGMVGIVFTLHFGVFHLLSCFWRSKGVEAQPLMNWPVAAGSVGEFWGRRWNKAFRDLAHRFLFQPLGRRFGHRAGLFAGFLFSGLVHDAVISLPARGGYCGPTAFFLIQAVGMLAERSRFGRRIGLGRGLRGRLFAGAVVVLPLPLLFPPPFVTRVVVPFLEFAGAAL